MITDEEQQPD